jgi:hypothetical protein
MSDFLDRAYDLLRLKTDGVVESKEDFENVFNAIAELQGVHSKSYLDLDNIEIVFGAIEMGLLLKRLGKRDEKSIEKLRNSLITLIYKTLEYSIPFPVGNKHISPPKPYNLFMNILDGVEKKQPHQDPHKFSFITFNYDLCLDFSLRHSGRSYDYCLETNREVDGCPLLKLHGSINWGLSEDQEIIPYYVHEAHFNFLHDVNKVYYNLGTNLHFKQYKEKPLSGPPVVVPPTWNKNSYHSQLSNVWSKAAYEISEAENIFIIGYSLPDTDSFFKYLYALGSESPKRLRNFIVVNKDSSGTIEKRFRDLIGKGIENRFHYIPKTFDDGLGDIKDILLNP